MPYPKIKKPYERIAQQQDFSGPSMTQQNQKAECDVNGIMAKWQKTRDPSIFQRTNGAFIDATMGVDYHTALNVIKDAQEAFAELPSAIRRRLDNDPAKFLEFMHNPDNHDEMVELGLIEPPVASVEAVATPAEPSAESAPAGA